MKKKFKFNILFKQMLTIPTLSYFLFFSEQSFSQETELSDIQGSLEIRAEVNL